MQVDQNNHNWRFIEINGEKILPICIYGNNRPSKVLEYQQKVMVEYFGLGINYVLCPFPAYSHGFYMDQILKATVDDIKPDYYWFIDVDALILKRKCIEIMYDFVKNKQTIAGQLSQSNHKYGPNGSLQNAYVSQAFLFFPTELYNKLGRPSMDHWDERADTAENLTYEAKLRGYIIAGIYPSSSVIKNSNLDNGCVFGMGNIYGENLCCHAMQQDNPDSEKWFIDICERVLDGEFEN